MNSFIGDIESRRVVDALKVKRVETMRLHVEFVPLHDCYGLISRNGHLVATMAKHGNNKRAREIADKLAYAWNLEARRNV